MAGQYKDRVMHIWRPKVFLWSVSLLEMPAGGRAPWAGHSLSCASFPAPRWPHSCPWWHHPLSRGDSMPGGTTWWLEVSAWSALSYHSRLHFLEVCGTVLYKVLALTFFFMAFITWMDDMKLSRVTLLKALCGSFCQECDLTWQLLLKFLNICSVGRLLASINSFLLLPVTSNLYTVLTGKSKCQVK